MKITSRKSLKLTIRQSRQVRPEVAKLIKELSKKYVGVWKDLAKV
ncbi:MAG: hypothetical protein Q8P92_04780 [Candidatus Daviesbacteria bacterium]|nr:hypothetical protein [Candidatus Daviesbacteria bacterium]